MDNIDTLIAQRIDERQRKLNIMAELREEEAVAEMRRTRWKKAYWAISAAAACACILLIAWPMLHNISSFGNLNVSYPQFEDYRGSAQNDLMKAIEDENYAAANTIADELMEKSNDDLKELNTLADDDPSKAYLMQIETDRISELLWAKVYIYSKFGDKEELISYLRAYLGTQENQPHEEEAKKLLNFLWNGQ